MSGKLKEANWDDAELTAPQKKALMNVMNTPGFTKEEKAVILAEIHKAKLRRRGDAS